MLYEEFLLRLAELVEESEDPIFFLCHFADAVDDYTNGCLGVDVGEYIAARAMLRGKPQCQHRTAKVHAHTLRRTVKDIEARLHVSFSAYAKVEWPTLSHNARRVRWLREEAAKRTGSLASTS